jgi:hypothetical protein
MKTEDGKVEEARCAPLRSQVRKKHKRGDTRGRPSWQSSFLGHPGAKSFWGFIAKPTAVVGAVGKVKIALLLRDFQVEWESSAFGLFHGTAFSTALVPTDCATSRKYKIGGKQ